MSGTVTHDVAQLINSVITPYIPTKYIVRSSDEALLGISQLRLQNQDILVSLDVESLFSNVPVNETIEIILHRVYHHEHKTAPPNIPKNVMRELVLCTTQTPFAFQNDTYLFNDGVAMGTPLGPTFADFYMSHLETQVLESSNHFNPRFYIRYVDDTLAVFKSDSEIHDFISEMKNKSVLNFTSERPENDTFQFLDIQLFLKPDGTIDTGVYVKPTDKGAYTNYHSYTPERYKTSIVKTLVHRAYRICSDWTPFHDEMTRIKQRLVNADYPLHLVDDLISRTLSKLIKNPKPENESTDINFFLENKNPFQMVKEETSLRNILQRHLIPTSKEKRIQVKIFYRNKKLSSKFSTRNRSGTDDNHVVYQFDCPEDCCTQSYIGYTTLTVGARAKQHRYKPSKIHEHFRIEHNK